MNSPTAWLQRTSESMKTKWCRRALMAPMMLAICAATTDSTSTSMRLNSSEREEEWECRGYEMLMQVIHDGLHVHDAILASYADNQLQGTQSFKIILIGMICAPSLSTHRSTPSLPTARGH